MKIALIGFGNMGKKIAELISVKKTHRIVSISFDTNRKKLDTAGILQADVVIDFTSPEIVMENIHTVLSLHKPLVVGTTGWYEHMKTVKRLVENTEGSLVYGQNFSIGANIFFKVVSYSAQLTGKFPEYDVYGMEIHHAGKKDSPSGTAKKISDLILTNFPRKKILQQDRVDRAIKSSEFHFVSVRGGVNPGRHEITFDSEADSLILSEQSHNRNGFAQGALVAADFIKERKGMYSFDEVFERIIQKV